MKINMQVTRETRILSLDQGRLVTLCGTGGGTVACVTGRLWVTHDGVPGDHVLRPGQKLTIDRAGVALVSGSPGATLEYAGLHRSAHCRPSDRLRGVLASLRAMLGSILRGPRTSAST